MGVGAHRVARHRDDSLDEECAGVEHSLVRVRARVRVRSSTA